MFSAFNIFVDFSSKVLLVTVKARPIFRVQKCSQFQKITFFLSKNGHKFLSRISRILWMVPRGFIKSNIFLIFHRIDLRFTRKPKLTIGAVRLRGGRATSAGTKTGEKRTAIRARAEFPMGFRANSFRQVRSTMVVRFETRIDPTA